MERVWNTLVICGILYL